MAAHELRQRVHHDVRPVLDRPQQDGRCHRVVDDQRNAVPVRDVREGADIADVPRRVPDAFAEDRLRLVVDQPLDGVGLIGFREPDGDALARQEVREQGVGGPVELRDRDEVAAEFSDVEHRIVQRRLPRAHAQGLQPALEGRDPPLQHRVRRVADAAVAKSLDLEVEQGCSVVGAVERVRDGLIDRDGYGLRRRVDLVAAVNGDRLAFHVVTSMSRSISRTTHSMSASVVRKLVMHARTTGAPPPRRTSDIHAICR